MERVVKEGAGMLEARRLVDSFQRFCSVRKDARVYAALMKVALVEGEPPALPGTATVPKFVGKFVGEYALPGTVPPSPSTISGDPEPSRGGRTGGGTTRDGGLMFLGKVGGLVTQVWEEAVAEGVEPSSEMFALLREAERRRRWLRKEQELKSFHELVHARLQQAILEEEATEKLVRAGVEEGECAVRGAAEDVRLPMEDAFGIVQRSLESEMKVDAGGGGGGGGVGGDGGVGDAEGEGGTERNLGKCIERLMQGSVVCELPDELDVWAVIGDEQ